MDLSEATKKYRLSRFFSTISPYRAIELRDEVGQWVEETAARHNIAVAVVYEWLTAR